VIFAHTPRNFSRYNLKRVYTPSLGIKKVTEQKEQKTPVVTAPTKVVGAIIQPDRSKTDEEENSPVFLAVKQKLQEKYNKIPQLPVSVQTKWLTLLNITMHALYYIEASSICHKSLATFIDDLQLSVFVTIFKVPLLTSPQQGSTLHVQTFHPIEDGGMGLFPYSSFALQRRQKILTTSDQFLSFVGLKRKENYSIPPYDERMKYWDSHLKGNVFGIADWKNQKAAKSFLNLQVQEHECFLRLPPLNHILTFTDDEFIFAVKSRLQIIPPPPAFSCLGNPQTRPRTPQEFTDHFFSCIFCSTELFHRRHEAVVGAIHHCCKRHGYDSVLVLGGNRETALPGNTKGGADVMIYANGKVYALDVTIGKHSSPTEKPNHRLNALYTEKIKKYTAYKETHPEHIVFPFVMNIYGTFHPKSIELLTSLSKSMRTDTEFRREVIRNTQCVLMKAMCNSLSRLTAKNSVGNVCVEIPSNEENQGTEEGQTTQNKEKKKPSEAKNKG
jgi:hypothetical protein